MRIRGRCSHQGIGRPSTGDVRAVDRGEPTIVQATFATGNFSVLGARPALGRTFTDVETWRTDQSVAVLSYRLWRDRFGSDRRVIGRTIQLDGNPCRWWA